MLDQVDEDKYQIVQMSSFERGRLAFTASNGVHIQSRCNPVWRLSTSTLFVWGRHTGSDAKVIGIPSRDIARVRVAIAEYNIASACSVEPEARESDTAARGACVRADVLNRLEEAKQYTAILKREDKQLKIKLAYNRADLRILTKMLKLHDSELKAEMKKLPALPVLDELKSDA